MKKVFKWLAIGFSVIVGLLLITAATVVALSNRAADKRYQVGVGIVDVPRDPASIARGEHIARAIAKCFDCHGEDLGGTMMIEDPAFGKIPAPNITRGQGSRTASYTDVDWARAIRHGVMPDGRATIIMPAEAFRYLSDLDLGAVIAFVKSIPPVDRSWPDPSLGPVARMLVAFNAIPIYPAATLDQERRDVRPGPEIDTTAEYGDYLTQVGGCRSCHNPAMSGGPTGEPGAPPASNLTPAGIGHWTAADFRLALREGKRPHTDLRISERYMPWKSSGRMTDDEIHAVWLFLKTLPSKEMGQR